MFDSKELAESFTDVGDFKIIRGEDFYRKLGFVFLEDIILRMLGCAIRRQGRMTKTSTSFQDERGVKMMPPFRKIRRLMFSSLTGEWETPEHFFKTLDKEFRFTLDPCGNKLNAKCPNYFEQGGLEKPWFGTVFLNPPYGRKIQLWLEKAVRESRRGVTVVAPLPSRTDTDWWHRYVMPADEIRFVRGRLKFSGHDTGAPFPSVVVVWRGGKKREAGRGKLIQILKSYGYLSHTTSEEDVPEEQLAMLVERICKKLSLYKTLLIKSVGWLQQTQRALSQKNKRGRSDERDLKNDA